VNQKKIIIIGGGAAGFFAAINCAQRNKNYSVTILEKSSKLLSKVRVSGGGRCNVTHACFENQVLTKNYPRGEKELQNVFSRFSTTNTVKWFEERNVPLKTEDDGRMFPTTNTSETIVSCLVQEAEKAGVTIKLNIGVDEIIKNANNTFTLKANGGSSFECDALIIATGGNAKETGYEWLKKLGHTINKPVPSLFTFNVPNNSITQLMGISVPQAKIRIAGTKLETTGPLLITHWGFSGPAVLKTSAWGARILNNLDYNYSALISWLPKYTEEKLRIELNIQRADHASKLIINTPLFELPKRLWEHLVTKSNISETTRWADLSKKQLNVLTTILIADEYKVQGKTTYKDEFVTCGGIALKEIDLTTMQSKIVPSLFFAGEVIDVDGITGGFNFQNAWSTAWIAAQNV
jgi:predicted Rossmann fold flavoprotein